MGHAGVDCSHFHDNLHVLSVKVEDPLEVRRDLRFEDCIKRE